MKHLFSYSSKNLHATRYGIENEYVHTLLDVFDQFLVFLRCTSLYFPFVYPNSILFTPLVDYPAASRVKNITNTAKLCTSGSKRIFIGVSGFRQCGKACGNCELHRCLLENRQYTGFGTFW